MAQKPDKKGGPEDKGKKKKKGKGGVVIFWLISVVVAFVVGFVISWQYRPALQKKLTSVFGSGAQELAKKEILEALDAATLDAEKKTTGRKAIETAYSKTDDASKKCAAKGEYEYKIANMDEKITTDEWEDIIGAFGG